jgi:hypothetical protein
LPHKGILGKLTPHRESVTSNADAQDTQGLPVRVPLSQPVENFIHMIRGQRVMLDSDLAALYGVETRVLIQATKRNSARFPQDFMFQFSTEELKKWRSQIVIANPAAKMGLRRPPYAFTEHGVAMLSAVNTSP